jgi:hypothetical protein
MVVELIIPIVMQWLILHAPGGQDIAVNIKQITSMRAGDPVTKNKIIAGEVRCVLNMDDGKFISVIETCGDIRRMINDLETAGEKQ